MSERGTDMAQRILASIIIVAMLLVMRIPLPVILFFAPLTYFIWRAVQRSDQHEIGQVFEFYLAADEILRDENRRWFGFEVAEVVENGERLLHEMPDAPPLVHFTLGALYQRAGEHGPAAEHLAHLLEDERGNEARRFKPSPELRRYAKVLRKIEREPTEAPQTAAALHHLEELRHQQAAAMLAASRLHIGLTPAKETEAVPTRTDPHKTNGHNDIAQPVALGWHNPALAPPPPISEVLRHVYEEPKISGQ